MDKNPAANAEDTGSIPGWGRFHMPQSSKAHKPQRLSPHAPTVEAFVPKACVQNKRSHHNDKCHSADLAQPKINE